MVVFVGMEKREALKWKLFRSRGLVCSFDSFKGTHWINLLPKHYIHLKIIGQQNGPVLSFKSVRKAVHSRNFQLEAFPLVGSFMVCNAMVNFFNIAWRWYVKIFSLQSVFSDKLPVCGHFLPHLSSTQLLSDQTQTLDWGKQDAGTVINDARDTDQWFQRKSSQIPASATHLSPNHPSQFCPTIVSVLQPHSSVLWPIVRILPPQSFSPPTP